MLRHVKKHYAKNAMLLTVKVAGATADQLYSIKKKTAAIIRREICKLIIQDYFFEMFCFEHVEYFQIVRN